MGFLPSCCCVNTSVWIHYLNANETHGKKAGWKQHVNAMCSIKVILEATPNKTATVVTCLPSYKPSNYEQDMLEKSGGIHKKRSLMDYYITEGKEIYSGFSKGH